MDNQELFERALKTIPGGVNSPVRSFGAVGGTPYFVERGLGAYVWDVQGNRYLDFVQSYGASILGHADPQVVEAIALQAHKGTTYGAPTLNEVLLAETVCEKVQGCEWLRLVSSGTEAAMSAIRLARGATRRDKIVKFQGCYHGHADFLLAGAGSGMATFGIPTSQGVTAKSVEDTIVVDYNIVPHLENDVACVIVEPIAANSGLIVPKPGFLEGLRAECDRVGALLIFDEVITGFRFRAGSCSPLVGGVVPDLYLFGKIIGGGLPMGAFGGRRELMGELAPLGGVYQAGTLSGNPLATAAGLCVLGKLDDGLYEAIEQKATRLVNGLRLALGESSVSHFKTLIGFAMDDYAQFFHSMLARGVAFAPGVYEVAFPSYAHSDDDIEVTIEVASEV